MNYTPNMPAMPALLMATEDIWTYETHPGSGKLEMMGPGDVILVLRKSKDLSCYVGVRAHGLVDVFEDDIMWRMEEVRL